MDTPPGKKQLTHDRIVETAARALRRGGFGGVGVAEVMKEAGLTHGGFYAHFESREALLAEAVARAGRDSAASLEARAARRRGRGESPLRGLIESYLSDAHLQSPEQGCPVAALVSDIPRQPAALRDAGAARVRSLLETVRRSLPDPAAADAEARAAAIASGLVGGLLVARALGINAQGKAALRAARTALLAQYAAN